MVLPSTPSVPQGRATQKIKVCVTSDESQTSRKNPYINSVIGSGSLTKWVGRPCGV